MESIGTHFRELFVKMDWTRAKTPATLTFNLGVSMAVPLPFPSRASPKDNLLAFSESGRPTSVQEQMFIGVAERTNYGENSLHRSWWLQL